MLKLYFLISNHATMSVAVNGRVVVVVYIGEIV